MKCSRSFRPFAEADGKDERMKSIMTSSDPDY